MAEVGPPFDLHEPSADEIHSAAADIERHAGDVENLNSATGGAQNQAVVSVAGLLEQPMMATLDHAKAAAGNVMQGTVVAGAACRRWGMMVAHYNRRITELNERWETQVANDFGAERIDLPTGAVPEDQAAAAAAFTAERDENKAALERELRTLQQQYQTELETGATEVAGALEPGAASEGTLRSLYEGGALSAAMAPAFPQADYVTAANPRARWMNLVAGGVIPEELWDMSAEDIRDYLLLNRDPERADEIVHAFSLLLGLDTLRLQEGVFLEALGSYDAYAVANTLAERTPGRDSLGRIEQGTARLREINARLAFGGRLTEGDRRYMHAWYDGVGADNLAALPGHVDRAISNDMNELLLGVSQADEDEYIPRLHASYLSPVADGIMNLSNPAVGGTDRVGVMPEAVQQLLDIRIGIAPPIGDSQMGRRFELDENNAVVIEGLDQYIGFADLLHASTVQGGDEFTFALGEQALHVKQDLTAIAAYADDEPGDFRGTYFVTTAEASDEMADAREAVASQLDPLFDQGDAGVNTVLAVVARNNDASSEILLDDDLRPALFMLPWRDDDGAVRVIEAGTNRDLFDGTAQLQDRAALAVIEDVARNRRFYTERIDGVARMSDDIARAVVEVGYQHLDAIARVESTAVSDVHEGLGLPGMEEQHRGLLLSEQDREGFLQFIVGVGGEIAEDFWVNSTVDLHNMVSQAMATGDAANVNNAMAWAGNFQGQYQNASYRYYELLFDAEVAARMSAIENAQKTAFAAKLVGGGVISGASFYSIFTSNVDPGHRLDVISQNALPRFLAGTFVPVVGSMALGGMNQWVDEQVAPSEAALEEAERQLLEAGATTDMMNLESTQARDYFLLAAANQAGFDPLDLRGADPDAAYVQALYRTAEDDTPIRDGNGNLELRDYDEIVSEDEGNVALHLGTAWSNTDHAWRSHTEQLNAGSGAERSGSLMTAEYYDRLQSAQSVDRRGAQPYPEQGDLSWKDEYSGHVWSTDYSRDGWSDEDQDRARALLYGSDNAHQRAPIESNDYPEYPEDPIQASRLSVDAPLYRSGFASSPERE